MLMPRAKRAALKFVAKQRILSCLSPFDKDPSPELYLLNALIGLTGAVSSIYPIKTQRQQS